MRFPFARSAPEPTVAPYFHTAAPQGPPPPSYPQHIHSPTLDNSSTTRSQYTWQGAPPPTPSAPELPSTEGPLKPWLGLRARLALSIVSPALLSLLFVGACLLISAGEIDDKVDDAKRSLLSACKGAESAATIAVSLPHFMADSANERTAKAIEDTVQGLGKVLMLSVTAIEKLLVFLVDAYRSLFLCFIELLVRGSLALLMSAVEIISDAVTSTAQTVRSAIQAAISDVNSAISTAVDGVNDIIGVFGQSIKAPQFTIPSLDALNNITIPTTFEDSLRNLNSSLPTLVDLKQKMDTLIETPFDKLKTDINGTISNFNFNRSLLPVPESNNLTFCNDLDTSSLDNLGHDLTKLAYIGLGILAAVAVGLMLLNMGREWWSWRSLEKHVEYTREAWLSIDSPVYTSHADRQQSIVPATVPGELLRTSNLFSLLQLSTHPLLAMLAFRFARPLGVKTPQARTSLRWFLAWISHPAAAAALVIGLVGLATVELQMAAIKPIQKHYEKELNGSLDSFGDGLLAHMNAHMQNASYDFAYKSNALIVGAQNDLNNGMFSWVNTTTSTMNETLNEFMDGIADALNDTFSNTPLYTPLQTFIDCIIGQKVAGIEEALTWMQDNAYVDFPTVSTDVLMLSRARSEEVIQPVKKAAVGTDDQEGLVPRIVNAYMRSLRKQRVQFLIFIEIYVLVFLVGLGIVLWHSRFQHMWAERKRRREAMRGLSPTPYPVSDSDNNRRDMAEKSHLSISAPLSNYGNVQSGAGNGNGQADDDMPVQPTLGSLLAEQTKSWDSFLDMPRDDGVKEAPSVRVAKLFGRKGGMATTSKPHTPPPLRLGHAKGRLHSVSESSIRSVKSKLSAEEIKPHPGNARVDADSEMRDTGDEPSSFVSRARSLFSGAVSWWFNLPDSPSTSGKNISKSTTARSSPVRFRPSSDESFATRDQSSEDEHERSRHLSVSQSSTFDTSRAEAMPKDWGREPLWSLIEPVVPQSFAPVPETRRENKRQLRFTATPTDQVEARKRRQEAEMPPIPLTPSRSLPQATPPSRSILSAPPPPPPPPSPPPPATHGHTRAQGPHFTAEQLYDAARKRRSYQYQAFEAGASGAPTRPLSLRSSLTRPPSWAKPHSGSRRPFSLDTATATGKVTGKPDRPRSQFPHRHPHRLSAITIGTTRAQTRTRTSMRTASAVRKHPSTLARSSGLQHIAESPSSCSWYEEAQRDEPGLAFGERVGTCLAHGQETGAGAGAQVRLDHVSPGANASPCPCLTPVIVRQGHAF